ncbi:MAG TPA: hypothetical protein VEX38_04895 [Fimbriimonadaceae bacterium]|nr:hypothetical protein [Fimbriimonadaceae bacterium]
MFNITLPDRFFDEVALVKLLNVLSLIRKVGCSVNDATLFALAEQGGVQARAVMQTIRTKYDGTT